VNFYDFYFTSELSATYMVQQPPEANKSTLTYVIIPVPREVLKLSSLYPGAMHTM